MSACTLFVPRAENMFAGTLCFTICCSLCGSVVAFWPWARGEAWSGGVASCGRGDSTCWQRELFEEPREHTFYSQWAGQAAAAWPVAPAAVAAAPTQRQAPAPAQAAAAAPGTQPKAMQPQPQAKAACGSGQAAVEARAAAVAAAPQAKAAAVPAGPAPSVGPATPAQPTACAAVAAGSGASAASTAVYDFDFFKKWLRWTDHYRQHGAALKWLRQEQETVGEDRLLVPEYTAVAVLVKGKGMLYSVEPSGQKSWCWLEMVAQLDKVHGLCGQWAQRRGWWFDGVLDCPAPELQRPQAAPFAE